VPNSGPENYVIYRDEVFCKNSLKIFICLSEKKKPNDSLVFTQMVICSFNFSHAYTQPNFKSFEKFIALETLKQCT
jgi:hypothetical protein